MLFRSRLTSTALPSSRSLTTGRRRGGRTSARQTSWAGSLTSWRLTCRACRPPARVPSSFRSLGAWMTTLWVVWMRSPTERRAPSFALSEERRPKEAPPSRDASLPCSTYGGAGSPIAFDVSYVRASSAAAPYERRCAADPWGTRRRGDGHRQRLGTAVSACLCGRPYVRKHVHV